MCLVVKNTMSGYFKVWELGGASEHGMVCLGRT